MLALGRALMADPRLLLLDEPSLGLAPQWSPDRRTIGSINQLGVAVLLVEQNAALALELSDYAYVLEVGRVVLGARPTNWPAATRSAGSTWARSEDEVPENRCGWSPGRRPPV